VLGLSLRSLRELEANGTLIPERDDVGRVYYQREDVERVREERKRNKLSMVVVDADEQGGFVVTSPSYDAQAESEAHRFRRDMEMREREYDQRQEQLRQQAKLVGTIEKFAPKFLEVLQRQSWSHVANTAISAIPEKDRSDILRAVLGLFQEGEKP